MGRSEMLSANWKSYRDSIVQKLRSYIGALKKGSALVSVVDWEVITFDGLFTDGVEGIYPQFLVRTFDLVVPQKTFLFALAQQYISKEKIIMLEEKIPSVDEILLFDPYWFESVQGRRLFCFYERKESVLEAKPIAHPAKAFSSLLKLWFCALGGLSIELYVGQGEHTPTYQDRLDFVIGSQEQQGVGHADRL